MKYHGGGCTGSSNALKSEKVSLNLNILKTKIMTSGPITSWQINGRGESVKVELESQHSPSLLGCGATGKDAYLSLNYFIRK